MALFDLFWNMGSGRVVVVDKMGKSLVLCEPQKNGTLENTLTRVKEEAKKSPLVARAAPNVVLFSIDK
jgi:hypothetical protein